MQTVKIPQNSKNSDFLSLSQYYKIAAGTVAKLKNQDLADQILASNDYLGLIVHHFVIADSTYDETQGTSRKTWRFWRLRAALKEIMNDIKKNKHVTLTGTCYPVMMKVDRTGEGSMPSTPESLMDLEELIEKRQNVFLELIRSQNLSPNEQKVLNLMHVHQLKQYEIAKRMDVSSQYVSYLYNNAIKKLKRKYNGVAKEVARLFAA